eukprot:c6267_g1_i1.p1 GENE.c6267_g1_i1~~c6267_g1_i1.p1  ORF type:complete len:272 (-),score=51.78 c6267_g1_i1:61-813(-)
MHTNLQKKGIGNDLADINAISGTLDLSWNEISDDGALRISELLRKCSLQTLLLTNNLIGSEGIFYIFRAIDDPQTPGLVTLDLAGNRIGDQGAEQISHVIKHRHCSLRTLNIAQNSISVSGARCIASAISSSDCLLRSLTLDMNPIGNEGACHLARAVHLGRGHRLRVLSVWGCGITPPLREILDNTTSHRSSLETAVMNQITSETQTASGLRGLLALVLHLQWFHLPHQILAKLSPLITLCEFGTSESL